MQQTFDEISDRAVLITKLEQLADAGQLDEMGYGGVRWHKPWFRTRVLISDRSSWAAACYIKVQDMSTRDLLILWLRVQTHLRDVKAQRETP